MLKVHYFAALRETLGTQGEELAMPSTEMTVAQLIAHLVENRDEAWSILSNSTQVLVAVDQTIVERTHALLGNEEIAFFPPMTGG
ncbi:MAG: molybdopterin converting factor subunit 1 [Gammaproteobacteria bacterium]